MNSLMNNPLILTDSYKVSHWKQYPPGTEDIYSYFESRGGIFDDTVFFGLQYIIKKYLTVKITVEHVNEARDFWTAHFGNPHLFNYDGWMYVVEKLGGSIPLSIRAVPEGSVIPTSNILFSVVNTDPKVPWITNWFETLLMQAWYPCIVATQSREMKRILKYYLEKTGTPELIDFKLHDFGFRGVSSVETAGIGAAAHLVNFKGTDTAAGLVIAREYYNEFMAGVSIPAAEHSTMTSWGRDRETEAYQNMLTQYPDGLVAVVSDSYDIYNACKNIWGDTLRDQVLARNGTLVIRPDSGDPCQVLPQILSILKDKFGSYTNSKGYEVLNDKVRLIQGDGVNINSLEEMLSTLRHLKWSADNIAFGSGGALLQMLNRDDGKFAIKCSAAYINGQWIDVYKDPITDPGKKSKAGRLKLVESEGMYNTVRFDGDCKLNNKLQLVFDKGYMHNIQNFYDIRQRAML